VKVTFILPALTEAAGPLWRPIKYSLFPPLGLATLAGFLGEDDEVEIQDEHVEALRLDDGRTWSSSRPTSPGRGSSPTSAAGARCHATSPRRTLAGLPPIRRDLIKRRLYLVPNSIVVSRGCPHVCDSCYKEAFFEGGRSFYTQTVDAALAEIERLPGRHLYFLDDHLFGDRRFATALFDGMRGMGRLWQAAGTVNAVLAPDLLEKAVEAGLRSLFVGFESLSADSLREQRKFQNLRRDYTAAVCRLHGLGVMINGSFVFGMDADGPDVFDCTVEWAIEQGIETATFHILTPYPGTAAQGRLAHHEWDLYDTRHTVFRPAHMTAGELERGYWRAYRDFYRWGPIARGAAAHGEVVAGLRHFAYAAGWKKFERLWDLVIRAKRPGMMLPVLELLLSEFGRRADSSDETASNGTRLVVGG
jgi:radical SAM superfamily enzyme YgiQ (UPF0313 family)